MFKFTFKGITININPHHVLRDQLNTAGITPHNTTSQWLNCKGLGTCGTCAIKIASGTYSKPTPVEKWRLNIYPFKNGINKGLRLACQTRLLSDGKAEKGSGFWGEIIK